MITKLNTYDLVIVGAGLSGFAAAVEAADRNLKTLLIEKGRTLGGTGNYVEGMFAVESEYQKKKGIDITRKQILDIEEKFTHRTANMLIWRDYINKSANNIEWMENHGVEFGEMRNLGTKGLSVWHIFKGHGATAINSGLRKYAINKGIEILTSTSAKELRLKNDGSIAGLVIEKYNSKETQYVQTNNIVLATGGFLNNPTLINELTDYDSKRVTALNSGKNTGDGCNLAWSVGAYKAKGFVMSFGGLLKDKKTPAFKLWNTEINNAPSHEGFLWVDKEGSRFANEDVSENWGVAGRSLSRQFKSYAILDQSQIDLLSNEGGPITNRRYVNLSKQIQEAKESKQEFLTVADSIDELANKLMLKNLVKTVETYNSFCEKKEDKEFNKDVKLLNPLRKAPFYAFEMNDGAFCAAGGLRINRQNEILNLNGDPIRGLYAVGNDAANAITGDSYDAVVSGAEAGYCIYSGRNAVENIVDSK